MLKGRAIHYIDVGTSGGVWGLDRGYCMMIGGPKAIVDRLDPTLPSPGASALNMAFAEGFDILKNANSQVLPEDARFDFDLADIAEVWRRGSVISSWLLDLTASALASDPKLAGFEGVVEDSGEGRWTIMAAIEEAVPADVLSAALYTRFRSRRDHTFAEKILSAMRKGFGAHVEPKDRKAKPS
jgi:6-phosphogluconate dehydrogenase